MKFTNEDLRALLASANCRQADLAWICGVNVRQVRAWCGGEYPVPQYAALLLMAYEEGLIEPSWFAKKIRVGVRAHKLPPEDPAPSKVFQIAGGISP